jgi:hypothetical protein
MKLFIALALTLAAQAAARAQAPPPPADQARWTHAASGATFPRGFGGTSISETRDLGTGWDSVIVYSGGGEGVESITIYLFRAALPDARLWFDRALHTVARDIPLAIFEAGPDTPFPAFGAAAPNGIFRIYRIDRPGPFRTTALAVAQAGPWLAKIRYSSASLDTEAMAGRIAALAEAIRFPDAVAPSALSAPVADCTRPPVDGTGRPAAWNETGLAAATVGSMVRFQAVRQPLGEAAGLWCRDAGFPAARATLLRRIDDPHDWILLPGDAGTAIAAVSDGEAQLPGGPRSVVVAVSPAFIRAAAMFEGTPPMMASIQAATAVLAGRSEGLFEISPTSGTEPR